MELLGIETSQAHNLANLVDYVKHSVVSKILVRKITGYIIVRAIDSGEFLEEKVSPFATYILIIEGESEIVIDNSSTTLASGQAILIPAHAVNLIRANSPSKMLVTVIKSGYEGIII